MKSVLISTQPRWCKLIASGKKTVEIRKTKPKLETPFKVYIYCTKGEPAFTQSAFCDEVSNGKVIGEFVCDKVYDIKPHFDKPDFCNQYLCDWNWGEGTACLSFTEINDYLNGKNGYGWHISDLAIYDKPMELSEFRSYNCRAYIDENSYPMPTHEITRPPQSWCYVKKGADHE
mgnify:CR=1 FL=1